MKQKTPWHKSEYYISSSGESMCLRDQYDCDTQLRNHTKSTKTFTVCLHSISPFSKNKKAISAQTAPWWYCPAELAGGLSSFDIPSHSSFKAWQHWTRLWGYSGEQGRGMESKRGKKQYLSLQMCKIIIMPNGDKTVELTNKRVWKASNGATWVRMVRQNLSEQDL